MKKMIKFRTILIQLKNTIMKMILWDILLRRWKWYYHKLCGLRMMDIKDWSMD